MNSMPGGAAWAIVCKLATLARRGMVLGVALAAAVALGAGPARAEISFVDQFRSLYQTQTGNGISLATIGHVFDARLFSSGGGDFDSAAMTYPGPSSPKTLLPTGATLLAYNSGFLATQAALDSEYPTGDYQYDADGSSGPDSTTLNYAGDTYPQSLPYLTGTNYSDLQGMDPTNDFAFEFSPFDAGSGATFSFLFFTIFDQTLGASVYDIGFQSPAFTGFTLPANTLAPNHQFTYELIFSNRVQVPSPGAIFDAQLGFDYRTQASFVTAPEPLSLVLLAQAGILAALRLRRRRPQTVGCRL